MRSAGALLESIHAAALSSTPPHKISLCSSELHTPAGGPVRHSGPALTSGPQHHADPRLLALRRASTGGQKWPLSRLHAHAALGFLAPRARPLCLAEAKKGGETPGRESLRALRLQSATLRSPRR